MKGRRRERERVLKKASAHLATRDATFARLHFCTPAIHDICEIERANEFQWAVTPLTTKKLTLGPCPTDSWTVFGRYLKEVRTYAGGWSSKGRLNKQFSWIVTATSRRRGKKYQILWTTPKTVLLDLMWLGILRTENTVFALGCSLVFCSGLEQGHPSQRGKQRHAKSKSLSLMREGCSREMNSEILLGKASMHASHGVF